MNKLNFLLLVIFLTACAPTATPLPLTAPAIPTRTPMVVPTETATIAPTPDKPIGTKKQSETDGMVQFYIPAGKFKMGTSADGDWIGENEFPLHEVFLNSFWMDETEITNAQYALCVKAGNCTPPHKNNSYSRPQYYGNTEFDNFPVLQVDWAQAKAYCEWAGRRLPTEAEWEKAARGTTERLYPWEGDAKGEYFANFSIYQVGDTTEVHHYLPGKSPYGIFDMAGNVYEWVADWYSGTYYSTSPKENPGGPETGTTRIIRGGAWSSDWIFIRTASRMYFYPQDFSGDIGFRCAQNQ